MADEQTYTITAPNGRTLDVTGDHVPTEAELHEIFKAAGVESGVQGQLRSRTGQMYTPPSDSGPIGEMGSHLVSGLNPVNVVGGVKDLLVNAVTDPKAAGKQVIDAIAAPFRTAQSGNYAGAAGDLLAVATMPRVYGAGTEALVNGTRAVLSNPVTREAAAAAVQHGPTALGAAYGGPGGAVVGATVGEQLAKWFKRPAAPEAPATVAPPVEAPMAAHLDRSVPARPSQLTQAELLDRIKNGSGTPAVIQGRGRMGVAQPSPPIQPAEAAPAVEAPPVKNVAQAVNEVAQEAKAANVRLSAAEVLEGSKLVSRGMPPDKAFENILAARELAAKFGTPSDAAAAAEVAARKSRR